MLKQGFLGIPREPCGPVEPCGALWRYREVGQAVGGRRAVAGGRRAVAGRSPAQNLRFLRIPRDPCGPVEPCGALWSLLLCLPQWAP